MKIKQIETFHVPPRWLFVRIEADNGTVGGGEASLEGSDAVHSRADPSRLARFGLAPQDEVVDGRKNIATPVDSALIRSS